MTSDSQPTNPYETPASAPDATRPVAMPEGSRRGLVAQTTIVGILMIVLGVFEVLIGLALAVYIAFVPTFLAQMEPDAPDAPGRTEFVMAFVGIMGGVMLLVAILRIIAGYNVIRLRRRNFAIASLGLGLLTIVFCYCLPTSVAMAVYGLIVLMNGSVRSAFDMAEGGMDPEQVRVEFARLPH